MSHSDRCAAARGCPRTAGGWSSRRRPALVPGPQSPSACGGSRVFDPTVVGTSVLYGYWSDDCGDGRESLRRFEPSTRRREQADLAGPGVVLSVARDGGDVHWLRGNVPRRECTAPDSPCELMRSRNPVFRPNQGRRGLSAAGSITGAEDRWEGIRVLCSSARCEALRRITMTAWRWCGGTCG
jgi:hypothetical protein